MAKAIWKGTVLAESSETIVIEGSHYFPPESLNKEHFQESQAETTCPWKGKANYYNVEVGGEVNENAAWYYADPEEKVMNIKNYVAFWNGVEVEE